MATLVVKTSPGQGEYAATEAGLNSAITAAASGDTITIEAGVTITGNWTLPNKGVLADYITITSDTSAVNMPAAGVRIVPGTHAAFMPKLQSAGGGASTISFANAANHYKFKWIEFLYVPPSGFNNIIEYGNGTQTKPADMPSHFIVDQCYLRGDATVGQRRGIYLGGKRVEVTNSYFKDFKYAGQDSQAIAGSNQLGPILIENNYLEGAAENFILGGSDPRARTWMTATGNLSTGGASVSCSEAGHTLAELSVGQRISIKVGTVVEHSLITGITGSGQTGSLTWDPPLSGNPSTAASNLRCGVVPHDLTFRRNHVKKNPDWRGQSWTVKNLFELKCCIGAQIDSNIFENNWSGQGGDGYSFWLKSVNQDGDGWFCETRNIVIEKNIIKNGTGCILFNGLESYGGNPKPPILSGITIRNNLFYDHSTTWGINRYACQIEDVKNLTLDHNTWVNVTSGEGGGSLAIHPDKPLISFVCRNNLFRQPWYGVLAASTAEGTASLNAAAPGWVFEKNAVGGANSNVYPANNFYPTIANWEAEFVDYALKNFRVDDLGAWDNAGTDGKDLGADIALVEAATDGVASGTAETSNANDGFVDWQVVEFIVQADPPPGGNVGIGICSWQGSLIASLQ